MSRSQPLPTHVSCRPRISCAVLVGAVCIGLSAAAASQSGAPAQPPTSVADQVQADLYQQLRFMQQELRELRGIVEALRGKVEKQQRVQVNQYLDLERRILKLEETPVAVSLPGLAGTAAASDADRHDEEADYQAAYSRILAREFDEAFSELRAFVARWPRSPQIPDALYWLGELYLLRKPPARDQALQVFMQVLQHYPEHSRIPDVLFKVGRIHHQKGKQQQAKEFFTRVVQEHGGTTAGQQAKAWLQRFD